MMEELEYTFWASIGRFLESLSIFTMNSRISKDIFTTLQVSDHEETSTHHVREMSEWCHGLILAETSIIHVPFPLKVLNINQRFSINGLNTSEWFLESVNGREQVEDWRSINLTRCQSEYLGHLRCKSLWNISIISWLISLEDIISINVIKCNFTNHPLTSFFIINLEGQSCSTLIKRFTINS